MASKRRSAFLKHMGPFHAVSYSQTGAGVYIVLWPAYPQQGKDWHESRIQRLGGGPGIFTSMAGGKAVEGFLNQPYSEEEIAAWKAKAKPDIVIRPKRKRRKHDG